MIKSIEFIQAGYCFHPERVVQKTGQWSPIEFPATVAVIEHSRYGLMLFDTGYGKNFHELTKSFPEKLYALVTPVHITPETTIWAQLEQRGVKQKDISHVFASHFHADHIGGLSDFTQSKYVSHRGGLDHLQQMNRLQQLKAGFLNKLIPPDFIERSQFIHDGDYQNIKLPNGVRTSAIDFFKDESLFLVDLPGHARGHYGLSFSCQGKDYLLVGDASWTLKTITDLDYPLFITSLLSDDHKKYKETIQSLNRIYHTQKGVQIIPCHCHQPEKYNSERA